MGKKQGKGKSSSSKASSANEKKCNCDHPYKCSCGNRPERPSKGHKWDPDKKEWAGKGHKQKGGGQAATVGTAAKITSVGCVEVKQWQKLPSKILQEWCKKEKRPRPITFPISTKGGSLFRYQIILPDAKKKERDMKFAPLNGCNNEEQAKEEACMLALMNTTPTLPHERVLPEPYKTTWLNAIEASTKPKEKAKPSSNRSKDSSVTVDTTSTVSSLSSSSQEATPSVSASSSSKLVASKAYSSLAEQRTKKEKKRQTMNKALRRSEALAMANKDHVVFLSTRLRKEIESFLRIDASSSNTVNNEIPEVIENDEDFDKVLDFLEKYGFEKSHISNAYRGVKSFETNINALDLAEKCLQWLCIHLEEDQLPAGFDPRERTLDVISYENTAILNAGENDACSEFGISLDESIALNAKVNAIDTDKDISFADHTVKTLVDAINKSVGASSKMIEVADAQIEDNILLAEEEKESLEAIFADECVYEQLSRNSNLISVKIKLGEGMFNGLSRSSRPLLEIVYEKGKYPEQLPNYVLVKGGWEKSGKGTIIQQNISAFLTTLQLREPMIYSIFMHVTSITEGEDSFKPMTTLMYALGVTEKGKEKVHPKTTSNLEAIQSMSHKNHEKSKTDKNLSCPRLTKRKRVGIKNSFFTIPPGNIPSVEINPAVPTSISQARKALPAAKAKTEFLSVVAASKDTGRVCLVTGETGCGKTTQVPQFLLEHDPNAKIVVTQPRRLAATGVATRVAAERGETSPGEKYVGYMVRGESAVCPSTRLLFCTTGILLRQLQAENALQNITHIIIDEVHERQLDTDVLLGVLKKALSNNDNLTIILMSATMNSRVIASYWGQNTPRMHIPGFTYPVQDKMLEDVLRLTRYIPPKKKKSNFSKNKVESSETFETFNEKENLSLEPEDQLHDDAFSKFSIDELVDRVDSSTIDYEMLAILIRSLLNNKNPSDNGSILVFLPGAPEIKKAEKAIVKIVQTREKMRLIPLHGGLQSKDQNLCFSTTPYGVTKIILSTNVAQTSITIPDCTVVIDTCREKQSSFDPVNRMPLLIEKLASRDSLKQRRGRAGRVREGTCYKLISKAVFERLPQHTEPEIHRCALDQTILGLFFLGLERGNGEFLSTLLDPPSSESVKAAIYSLIKLGALENHEQNEIGLTPLGCHLAGIPAPPRIGKLLVIGSLLGCRNAALSIAACLSSPRSPFERVNVFAKQGQREQREEAIVTNRDAELKRVGNSDHLLFASVYLSWMNAQRGYKKSIIEKYGLLPGVMQDIKKLYHQLDSSLSLAGFEDHDSNANLSVNRIVRATTVAAFAPEQLVKVQKPLQKYSETIEGSIEKDAHAKEFRFFVRSEEKEERVFIHPSSANLKIGKYNCPWLVYNKMVHTTKPFLMDITECSSYSLLLFGGKIEVQAVEERIIIDGWVTLSAAPRIGALVGALRKKIDELLVRKISEPRLNVSETKEMKLLINLLTSDGLS